jgi:hypothetical protein
MEGKSKSKNEKMSACRHSLKVIENKRDKNDCLRKKFFLR